MTDGKAFTVIIAERKFEKQKCALLDRSAILKK